MARIRQPKKVKEPVRLQMKELSNGSKSLYLDIYRNGKRTYEYLKLYIIPETDENARKDDAHFALLVENDKIAVSDYNISVSSYVEQPDTREEVDIEALNLRIAEIVARQNVLRTAIDTIVATL